MANELVSILVPVYNNEKYMRRTLDCILSQTYKNWELIVTNDGSDDGTADILHEYVRKDSRIFVKHEKCGGGYHMRGLMHIKELGETIFCFWIMMIFFIRICLRI